MKLLSWLFTVKNVCCRECRNDISILERQISYLNKKNKKLNDSEIALKDALTTAKQNHDHWYNQSQIYKQILKDNGLFNPPHQLQTIPESCL